MSKPTLRLLLPSILILTSCTVPQITYDLPPEVEQINAEVPFTTQAPFAEWDDPRQQDGCEEASALMAIGYLNNKTYTKQEAKDEILAITAYLDENYGSSKDTNVQDTAERILKGYFQEDRFEIKTDITKEELIQTLQEGHPVIIPANGKALKNPNFSNGGPDKHMLIIKSYDTERNDFITNDPGTRNGENYRYNEDLLYNAIHNYETSGETQNKNQPEKSVIIISRTK